MNEPRTACHVVMVMEAMCLVLAVNLTDSSRVMIMAIIFGILSIWTALSNWRTVHRYGNKADDVPLAAIVSVVFFLIALRVDTGFWWQTITRGGGFLFLAISWGKAMKPDPGLHADVWLEFAKELRADAKGHQQSQKYFEAENQPIDAGRQKAWSEASASIARQIVHRLPAEQQKAYEEGDDE